MLEFALGIRRKIGYWLSGYRFRPSGGFHGPLADKGKVLLVADVTSEKARDAVSGLKTELKRICPKAQLNIAGFYNKEKGVTYNFISDDKVKYFTEDSFSFFFQFKDEDVKSLLTSGYDMAIFFTGQDNIMLDYASSFVVADLRLGWTGSYLDKIGLLNFSIIRDSDLNVSVRNIIENLKMIFK